MFIWYEAKWLWLIIEKPCVGNGQILQIPTISRKYITSIKSSIEIRVIIDNIAG